MACRLLADGWIALGRRGLGHRQGCRVSSPPAHTVPSLASMRHPGPVPTPKAWQVPPSERLLAPPTPSVSAVPTAAAVAAWDRPSPPGEVAEALPASVPCCAVEPTPSSPRSHPCAAPGAGTALGSARGTAAGCWLLVVPVGILAAAGRPAPGLRVCTELPPHGSLPCCQGSGVESGARGAELSPRGSFPCCHVAGIRGRLPA